MSEQRQFVMFICAIVAGVATLFCGMAYDAGAHGASVALATIAGAAAVAVVVAWMEVRV